MASLNYNYTAYDDFEALATKQPELGERLIKEYGKEESWMHNPLTVYNTVRDYATYEVLSQRRLHQSRHNYMHTASNVL